MVQSLLARAGRSFRSRPSALKPSAKHTTKVARVGHGLIEALEPRQLLTADLALEVSDALTLPSFLVPGDRPVLNFLVRNNSSESFTGRVNIRVQMFPLDTLTGLPAAEATYAVTLPTSVQITGLASDAALAINLTNFDMPAEFNVDGSIGGVTPGQYFIVGTIFRPDGQTWTDEFAGNDQVDVTFDEPIEVQWAFGNVEDRTNVTFIATDTDDVVSATRFSMTMTGGGFGFFVPQDEAIGLSLPPVQLNITYPTASAASVWNVNSLAAAGAIGMARTVDLTMDVSAFTGFGGSLGTFTINAANLNLTGNGDIEIDSDLPLTATFGAITGEFSVGNTSSTAVASVRSFTMGDLEGDLNFNPAPGFLGGGFENRGINVAALRVGNITNPPKTFSNISVQGDATVVTLGNTAFTNLSVLGNGTSFRAGNMDNTDVDYGGRLATFVAGNINDGTIGVNQLNRPYRTSTTFTALNVVDTALFVNGFISNLSVNRWTVGALGGSVGYDTTNAIFARAFGTVTTRNTGTGKNFLPGDFDATLVAAGGINRPTQIASVNIAGEFGGFIVSNGSVGSITAGSIDTFGTGETRVVPSILVNGRLGTLTSPNLVDGEIYASNIGTITATLRSNAFAQALAGVRFNINELTENPALFNTAANLSFGSGAVANLNLTINTGATGINFRASAGVLASALTLGPTTATTTILSNTISRLGAATITGVLGTNVFRLGFISFPAVVRFGAVNVAVPAIGAITSPGDTLVRLARPV